MAWTALARRSRCVMRAHTAKPPPQDSRMLLVRSVGTRKSLKNCGSHIHASHSRQPLIKGERLVRYEVNAVMPMAVRGNASQAFRIFPRCFCGAMTVRKRRRTTTNATTSICAQSRRKLTVKIPRLDPFKTSVVNLFIPPVANAKAPFHATTDTDHHHGSFVGQ